jgi:hypothetical protein
MVTKDTHLTTDEIIANTRVPGARRRNDSPYSAQNV